ncbi:MAG TPA: AAA family ATPase [Candidatus Omnitrophota bacterium]|nr:AAA family ATPase [Candidatus Omnitrophota bacterium]
MKIKKITLENIRSYEFQEVNFPEGSVLLAGDIGSGKTSILLGIEFALFGLQPGQRGNALLRHGAESGRVLIEFEVEGQSIVVERTLKKGKTISQDYCSISVNGENKREISVTELKSQILDLLNYPREFSKKQNLLYKFTVYTPQEEMKEIILEDPEVRINTLRHIFGIDKYKRILENTSLLSSVIREEKREKEGATENLEQEKLELVSKEEDLESKYYNLSSMEKELFLKKEIKNRIQDEKDEIAKEIDKKRKFQSEIEKTNLMIFNKKYSISDNLKIMEQLKLQISELENVEFNEARIPQLSQEIENKKHEKEELNEKIQELNSQIALLNSKNEANKELERKMANLEICPTCLQNVGAVYKANILNNSHSNTFENTKKIEIFDADKKNILDKSRNLNSEISSKERELTDLKILKMKIEGIKERKERFNEIQKVNQTFDKDIEMLKQHVDSLNASIFELNKFDSLFEAKQKELDEAQIEERNAEIKVAELRKEIEVFSRQIDEMKERIGKMEMIRKQLDYLSALEDWLTKNFLSLISLIEKNVMIKLKAEFSRSFSEWFAMLVSDNFHVRLSDDFTPVVEQQDYEIDYAYLSGGERTAIALAYRLSLNQVINSFLSKIKTRDLVILDEPTDGFSEQQLDKMRGVLEQLNVNQLIIVSHEQKIESFVDNIIKLRKEQGISKLE